MEDAILRKAEERMLKALEHTQHEFNGIRTGRASAGLLDSVRLDYYGTPTPLNQVASINVPEAKLIVVQPWDKALAPEIIKAIQRSDLGLNPSTDGQVIRLPIPPLNEERRRELTKHAARLAEDGKVAARNVRRDANDEIRKLEKDSEITEDASRRAQAEVQKLTDKTMKRFDEILESKRQEIMEG